MIFPVLKKIYGDEFDVNVESVMNVCWLYKLSLCDVVDVVAALYNPFETC